MSVFRILERFSFGHSYTSSSGLNIAENGMFSLLCLPLEMHASFPSWDYKIIDLVWGSNIGLKCIISKGQGQKKDDETDDEISPLIEREFLPAILSREHAGKWVRWKTLGSLDMLETKLHRNYRNWSLTLDQEQLDITV
ncbi:MAG: hypothetical protein M1813_004825 [Trichoglossum hirsutum]|nr:MAG: hypothetical protein M1813_004825 [Trichoglossum hirsutum]